MEALKESVAVRVSRINNELVKRSKCMGKICLLNRECLLDVLQVLYDECSSENLQRNDRNIAEFVKKYEHSMKEIKSLRVNVSDFEIKNLIGAGQFGEVYVVKEKQTGDIYAMKSIRKFKNGSLQMSFEEERYIMAFSNSPWLTALQHSFHDCSNLFFVMEFHPGGDLTGLLNREGGTLPETAAVFYLAELVLALDDLHQMGFVHRDIKPDNILIDRCGHVKLADFGSAARLDKDGLIKTGPPIGTPHYIAPEVLQCLDNKCDSNNFGYGVSCDYWSMGVVAYELTIGCLPFQGQNTVTIYSKILNHGNILKLPSDVALSQAYIHFTMNLLKDTNSRLTRDKIRNHVIFKSLNFGTLKDQVPPFVPRIQSPDDSSNFADIEIKKKHPSIENFKKRSQFSGRNLPFVGFTFTHDSLSIMDDNGEFESQFTKRTIQKKELIDNMKMELDSLRMKVSKSGDLNQEKEILERKLEEQSKEIDKLTTLRDKLEKELATTVTKLLTFQRTIELERKERVEIERKALDLVKSAKLKWKLSELNQLSTLNFQIKQQNEKILQLTDTNKILEEQLQQALKTEEKNKLSLATAQTLSRKSVAGLENRLEKITSETQNTIYEMQRKLSEKSHEQSQLEHEVKNLQESEGTLQNKLKLAYKEYDDLKLKVDVAEQVSNELNQKLIKMEKAFEINEIQKQEFKKLQREYETSQETIKSLQNHNALLQRKCKLIDEQNIEIQEMKQQISRMQNDECVSILEKQLEQEMAKCENLKKRLEEQVTFSRTSQEIKDKQLQCWRVEKELSNCKIDNKILERELKDTQTEIKELKEKLSESELTYVEYKKGQEIAVLELSNINETMSIDLIKAREDSKNLQEQLQNEKQKRENEKIQTNEFKSIIKSKDDKIRLLEANLNQLQREIKMMEKKCMQASDEKSTMYRIADELRQDNGRLNDEIDKQKREIINLNLNLKALREACILMENQIIEYESLLNVSKDKESELKHNTEKLISNLCKSRLETQEARQEINEEKSLRALSDNTIHRLEEDKECLEKECDSYKNACMEYKRCWLDLCEQLTCSDEKLSNAESLLKSHERQIQKYSMENKELKKELTEHITRLSQLRESNYKLEHQLTDFKETNAELLQKVRELDRILHDQFVNYKEREIKMESVNKQQTKLIDYLQIKLEEHNNKKKSFAEVLFGSSKKEQSHSLSLMLNYKDLENELTKEKQLNKHLKQELTELKSATLNEANLISNKSAPIESGDMNLLLNKKNQLHKFDSKLCLKSEKCAQCNHKILLGRNYKRCQCCNVVAHIVCAKDLMVLCTYEKNECDETSCNELNLKLENLLKLPKSVTVNCIIDLTENIQILGTENGLYSYCENKLLHIDGIDEIGQLGLFLPGNTVLMIIEPKLKLITCDINHLITLIQCGSRRTLKYKAIDINNLNGFHLLEISQKESQHKIAVATSKQLIILEFNFNNNEFIPLRILDTAQPTSCMLFTDNSLIVGADKFFEIDLKTFVAEEFLDVSDVQLRQVVKCYKMGSFPISILEISSNPKEYLLSFNELSIFIDEFGRSSRKMEIQFNHLPLTLHLAENNLYIVQFAAIEILKMTEDLCNEEHPGPYRLLINRFRPVGFNKKGIYLQQETEIKFVNVRKLPDYDAVSLLSDNTTTTITNTAAGDNGAPSTPTDLNCSGFSFTSSIVQSLDGNGGTVTSEECSEDLKMRTVQFMPSDV